MNQNKTMPQEQQSYPPLRSIADAVRYFIQSMDIDMLYTLLDDKNASWTKEESNFQFI
jgi:hypothetical protein